MWNPDEKQTMNFFDQWQEVRTTQVYDNGFKIQWEHFIRHVVENAPYKWTLPEGAKGVQLVEAALESWKERRWIDVPAAADLRSCYGFATETTLSDGRLVPDLCVARRRCAPCRERASIGLLIWWPDVVAMSRC